MSEQTKLEVSIPIFVTDSLKIEHFRIEVRGLLREHGGEKLSRYRKEPLCWFIHAVFPDRSTALSAVKAIRKLSLEEANGSEKNFTYIIDNDELLLFNDEADEYSFESKNYTDVLQEWHEDGRVQSPVLP